MMKSFSLRILSACCSCISCGDDSASATATRHDAPTLAQPPAPPSPSALYDSWSDSDTFSDLQSVSNESVTYFSLNGIKTTAKVVDIYDGDTCTIVFVWRGSFVKFKCRLAGIDCPEMRPPKNKPDRQQEIADAIRARNEVIRLVTSLKMPLRPDLTKDELKALMRTNTKLVTVECFEFDKYGRLLVNLYDGSESVNQHLIQQKFAKAYDGGTKEVFEYEPSSV